jgi:hypothetical protein
MSMHNIAVPQIAFEAQLAHRGGFSDWYQNADDSELVHHHEELCAALAQFEAKGIRSNVTDLMVERRDLIANMIGLR